MSGSLIQLSLTKIEIYKLTELNLKVSDFDSKAGAAFGAFWCRDQDNTAK